MAGGEVVARNYAGALFDLGLREGRADEFGRALEAVADLLQESSDLRTFLETPRIDRSEKKRVVRKALEAKVPASLLSFLQLVIDKRRSGLLREMDYAYRALLDEHLGRVRVEVSVARDLDEAALTKVSERLADILGKDVIPHLRVRPELLGGVVFRSGDMVFDGSVRRRLERMRRRLMTADLPTDQQVA